jgi:hypothetical protein
MSDFVKVRSEYPPTVALSELALEIPEPTGGWANWLAAKGIKMSGDDIGRDAIARHHAKRLLDEQREEQLRRAALARLQEQEAVAEDARRRAQIWGGVPASALPADASPAAVMLQAAKEARPKRTSVLEESLSGGGLVFHPLRESAEGE